MVTRSQNDYNRFKERIQSELMTHEIIVNNKYTKWFKDADLSIQEVRHFAVQFSVFSNWFMVAQLKKVINAGSLEEMRKSKEILASELGTVFNNKNKKKEITRNPESDEENILVSTEGTVDGGKFLFKAAHFEWMLDFGKPLDLQFNDLGKLKHGTKTTLHFMNELERLYANEDFSVGSGASYAVENWAAAGFWKELIQGLEKFKKNNLPNLPLSFFKWHDKVEDQHASHTHEELKEVYFYPEFSEEEFIQSGKEMLAGVQTFWDGLNNDRLKRNTI